MRFEPDDGNKPTQKDVKTGTLATPPQYNPQRTGFRFDGWTLDNQPFYFQTPVLQDMTLTAKWTKATDWTLSPDHGPASGAWVTISSPSRQEPCFSNIQAAGEQMVGLTGDGRIYTWTKDSTPVQVPFPAQAPDGFHYLQAEAGSRWQAALGSDQHIYTWTSRQTTSTILDAVRNTGFTSISINDDRLLAVDRQGRVHAFRASQADSQNQNPKLTQQTTTSLPGQAQAVTAATSASRALIVDADGQAWAWDANNTGEAKPADLKQDPGTRIVQVQALNQGYLLLDTDGHTYYQADSTTSFTAVSLPESLKASRITANKEQAMITGKDGRVWAWKPGEAPKRADNENQQYAQAAKAASRVTAIDRQGSMLTWSPDEQGKAGKPARLDTAQAPTLESASMDGQALMLSRKDSSWKVEIPGLKPRQTVILITGRQDGQPFTRSLNYTVDQPLTRDAEPRSTLTVHFDTGGGNPKPEDQNFSTPNSRAKRPSPDPKREGYLFDGWFIDEVAYDFSKPVTKDLTLTAKWTESRNSTWSISPDKGGQTGNESTTITPPDSTRRGIRFSQVSGSTHYTDYSHGFTLAVGSDGNAYAWGGNSNGQLGNGTASYATRTTTPVMVKKPARAPANFTYVQVSAGGFHSLAIGSDGYVYAWGLNNYGQLGDGTTTNRATPVKVEKPAGAPANFTYLQVSGGFWYSLALGSDGNAYAWGFNQHGEHGDGTYTERHTPVKVRKPAGVPANFTYLQVSGGTWHSLALGSDGKAYSWGDNSYGTLGDGTDTYYRTTPVMVKKPTGAPTNLTYVQVSAGRTYSLALGSDGNAWAWGDNENGKLGDDTTTERHTPVMVKKPADAPTDLTYEQVSAGEYHSLALGSDGNAYAWGLNDRGQLGDDTTTERHTPVMVKKPADAPTDLTYEQVSAGEYHSLALGSDGNAWAWGNNNYGQLGDGTTNEKSNPVPVVFNLQLVITGVRFDQTPASGLTRGDGNSVTVLTPAHAPGTVTVGVDYTLGGAPQQPDTSLRYTYLSAGVLPRAGGEGILLALATGTVSMGVVLASRRHRKEQRSLSHTSHE
ncbi:RCC1 domain-containing protein [Bifidobacterium sp. ESL0820]|uniref:RCC1 domain-containing protein n=1 Tax=Bifidobacterium sp. ESL0820 TaxID=3448586 RepID=UPI0040432A3E